MLVNTNTATPYLTTTSSGYGPVPPTGSGGVAPVPSNGVGNPLAYAALQDVTLKLVEAGRQLTQAFGGFAGAPPGGAPPGGAPPGVPNPNGGAPTVAVLDDFTVPHGPEIAGIIESQGANTLRFGVNGRGGLSGALAGVMDRLAAGQKIDAINISQQAYGPRSPDFQTIDRQIEFIQQRYGVPVVVAAGNFGPGNVNLLSQSPALVVENSLAGSEGRAARSGLGNIRAEGSFTSQATANVSAHVALARSLGATPAQAVLGIQNQARLEGGSLDV